MVWEFNKIKDYIKDNMSEKRFKHVLGVVETAKDLAKRHGVNVDDAALVALVHDVVKEQEKDVAKQILIEKGEGEYLKHSAKIWHAPLGAFVANEQFGIENEDILNAIKYHTTGRPKMSTLEKVLFVADYTEPNRQFEGAIAVRENWDALDKAVHEILKQKIEKIITSGLEIHPNTLVAYEYYDKLKTP